MRNSTLGSAQFPLMAALMAALVAGPMAATAAEYKVDNSHTGVTFKIRHLFTNVSGRFDDFTGKVVFDPADFSSASVEGTIQAASVNTNNKKRDDHLKKADFFDVAKYPTITFKSTKVTDIDAAKKSAKLHGNLTMRGIEKPIVLDVAYLGTGKDPWGNTRGGFTATGTIHRKDFGINWNETLDSGGLLIGEDVEVELNVEAFVVN